MLIFKCALQPDEIIALQQYLPADEYCLINFPGDKTTYGIMNDELHSRLMDLVSGETLECLEYLDESDLRKIGKVSKGEVIGNGGLIDNLFI